MALNAAAAPKRSHHAKLPTSNPTSHSITKFFQRPAAPPQVGRPPGMPPKKCGRPPAEPQPEARATPSLPPPAEPQTASASSSGSQLGKRAAAAIVGVKLKRINWGEGEHLVRMTKVVADWDAKTGDILLENPAMDLKAYASAINVSYSTMRDYCCADLGKRKVLGTSVGKKPLFTEEQQQFAVDVIHRHDRGNDGLNKRECVDKLHDMRPNLSRRSVEQSFDRTVRPHHKEELTGIVKANHTTSKRTAITVPQQWRWHQTVEQGLAFLREHNTGVTPDGKSFGEVMDHFVHGGDETCFLASNGDVSIIGDKKKPKHDLPTGSDRTSITVYRNGSAAGATGPTAFLPPGQRRKAGYTDKFLVEHGAPKGSTIVMTPTGYMTEEAWLEMAPTIADGIREMPVVSDMPDWWVLKIIDGFGPHTSSECAMELYAQRKILLLKEEGDSSHVNQSYDQKVALDDKKSMRQSLAYLRQSNKLNKGTIDGWALIHVALAAVRELDSDSWVYSFNKVNLKPSTQVTFPEWIKRIEHYIQGGASFKPETVRDEYALLSPFWHSMLPEEKKLAMSVFQSHESTFTVECVKALASQVHVPMPEMQNLRVGIELALKDPSHLERGKPEAASLEQPREVRDAQAQVASVTAGLKSFELHPKGADGKPLFKGLAHFDHLVNLARRSVPTSVDLVPSATLDVEYSKLQQRLINPRPIDYAMHEIAKQAHGEGAKQAMAKRKMDNLGYMRGDSGFANDPERRRRLKNQLGLTKSVAAINKQEAEAKAAIASHQTATLIDAAPAALKKLVDKGDDLEKITMAEMSAIAFKHFKGTVLKGNKAAHVKELGNLMKTLKMTPATLQATLPAPPPTAPPPAAPPLAALPPTGTSLASDDGFDDDSDDDEEQRASKAMGRQLHAHGFI